MVATEPSTHHVAAEPLLPETFTPFGRIIAPGTLESMGGGRAYSSAIEGFVGPVLESDHEPVEILLSRSRVREYRVHYFERHLGLTQTYVPLNGHPFIWVLAPPDAREENGVPAFDEVRAFVLPGDAAVMMHRGTWHEAPFPSVTAVSSSSSARSPSTAACAPTSTSTARSTISPSSSGGTSRTGRACS